MSQTFKMLRVGVDEQICLSDGWSIHSVGHADKHSYQVLVVKNTATKESPVLQIGVAKI